MPRELPIRAAVVEALYGIVVAARESSCSSLAASVLADSIFMRAFLPGAALSAKAKIGVYTLPLVAEIAAAVTTADKANETAEGLESRAMLSF